MSSWFNNIEIVRPSPLGRNSLLSGLIAHSMAETRSSGLGRTTAKAAGQTAPISLLFVNHDAFASLTSHASSLKQFGSVTALLNQEGMP